MDYGVLIVCFVCFCTIVAHVIIGHCSMKAFDRDARLRNKEADAAHQKRMAEFNQQSIERNERFDQQSRQRAAEFDQAARQRRVDFEREWR